MIRIDSHHHLWQYNTEDYGWIPDEMAVLRRDFLPEDLKIEIDKANIDKVITVQARQCLKETDWLLSLAGKYSFIGGITGWLPIQSDNFASILEKYIDFPKLKALRHVVQDEPDDWFLMHPKFLNGVKQIMKTRLLYEILIFERQLPAAIDFVNELPDDHILVLDHIAKPLIKKGEKEPWESRLRELAKHENVYCKLSGLVTEADLKKWTFSDLQPYMEIVLEIFGANRVMFGSDWPVCTSATTYSGWVKCVSQAIEHFSENEQNLIMGGNAVKIYGVNN